MREIEIRSDRCRILIRWSKKDVEIKKVTQKQRDGKTGIYYMRETYLQINMRKS